MLSYTQNGVKGRRSGREKTRKKLKYDGTYLCMSMSVVSLPFLFGHVKGTYFLSSTLHGRTRTLQSTLK